MATTPDDIRQPAKGSPSVAEPMFDSLDEERAYHAAKAEQFKTRLNQQVEDLKADTTAKVKRGAIWGGAFLASMLVVRAFSKKESLVWTAVKGAALLGAGVVAKDTVLAMKAVQEATDEQEPGLEQDPTEL